jgi:hypothetical protein
VALKLHIAKPVEKLAEMLSQSSHAQALLGVASAGAAAEKIHFGYGEDEEFELAYDDQRPKPLPRFMVALSDFNSQKNTTSSWTTTVSIDVMIECLTLTADALKSASERYMAFLERVEGVVDDLRDQAASGTKLNITDMNATVPPQQADPKKTRNIGEVWWTVLRIEAGG